MSPLVKRVNHRDNSHENDEKMTVLFRKLDEAIDDLEQGRVQTIEEAWKDIDAI